MPRPLVIVESPAKAKTIPGLLGRDSLVDSSLGHIRDLPRNAAEVLPEMSAGRVQSVATRIVVERERKRMRFRSAEYWDIEGTFAKPGGNGSGDATQPFPGRLVEVDGTRVATGRDFTEQGELSRGDA